MQQNSLAKIKYSKELLDRVENAFGKDCDLVKEFKKGRTTSLIMFFSSYLHQEQRKRLDADLVKELSELFCAEEFVVLVSGVANELFEVAQIYKKLVREIGDFNKKSSITASSEGEVPKSFTEFLDYPLNAPFVKRTIEENSAQDATVVLVEKANQIIDRRKSLFVGAKIEEK